MSTNNIHRIDLNLLVVLDALLAEGNVGRTASRLNLTQSAVSHALRRLRELFDDPLFVRTAYGITPTARTLELAPQLRAVLDGVRDIVMPSERFEPARSTESVVIGMTDYASVILMPALSARLQQEAPHMRCVVRAQHPDLDVGSLDSEALDLSISPLWGPVPKRIAVEPLFHDRFVLVCRLGHPVLSGRVSLDAMMKVSRIVLTGRIDGSSVSEPSLIRAGIDTKPAMIVPHFLAAPFILERTDHFALLPERLSRHLLTIGALQVLEPPIALPDITMALMYHQQKVAASRCLQWLAGLITTLRDPAPGGPAPLP